MNELPLQVYSRKEQGARGGTGARCERGRRDERGKGGARKVEVKRFRISVNRIKDKIGLMYLFKG